MILLPWKLSRILDHSKMAFDMSNEEWKTQYYLSIIIVHLGGQINFKCRDESGLGSKTRKSSQDYYTDPSWCCQALKLQQKTSTSNFRENADILPKAYLALSGNRWNIPGSQVSYILGYADGAAASKNRGYPSISRRSFVPANGRQSSALTHRTLLPTSTIMYADTYIGSGCSITIANTR